MSNVDPKTAARIIHFCANPPAQRTWDEIVSCIAGVNAMRDDLSDEDAAKVHLAGWSLCEMAREGRMVRECATDPREDLYVPAK